jgi:hypothetical protein
MKVLKLLLAISALTAVTAANATTYNVSGTGLVGNTGLPTNVVYTGTGNVNTTGSVFNSGTFNYTANATTDNGYVNAIYTGQFVFANASGSFTETILSCADSGETHMCSSLGALNTAKTYISTSDFSDLSSLSWSWTTTRPNLTYPLFLKDSATQTFTATPAVPVPAAAWLMGSALVGLASTSRRRRVA